MNMTLIVSKGFHIIISNKNEVFDEDFTPSNHYVPQNSRFSNIH